VKTIQCSNCGAPLDLEHDTGCRYCGSPISVLDPDAVAKTVSALADAQTRASTIDVGLLAKALLMPPPPDVSRPHLSCDLVSAGIATVAALLLRRV
jgi:DNA-directed RNA polymerase subunit RPC12/RpoP